MIVNRKIKPAGTAFLMVPFFLSAHTASAQTDEQLKQLHELSRKRAEIYIAAGQESKKYTDQMNEIVATISSFGAFTLGWEISKAEIKMLNADLAASGFPGMNDKFSSLVFGYSRMNRRVTGNLLFHATVLNKVENTTHTVRVSGAGASWDKGYAVIENEKMLFHPFAGIGWQTHSIRVEEKNGIGTVNNLPDVAQGIKSGAISQNTFYGMLGAELDLIWPNKKNKRVSFHTGIRFAYQPEIADGKYRYSNTISNYKPEIKWRQFQLSLFFKIAGKTYFAFNRPR